MKQVLLIIAIVAQALAPSSRCGCCSASRLPVDPKNCSTTAASHSCCAVSTSVRADSAGCCRHIASAKPGKQCISCSSLPKRGCACSLIHSHQPLAQANSTHEMLDFVDLADCEQLLPVVVSQPVRNFTENSEHSSPPLRILLCVWRN